MIGIICQTPFQLTIALNIAHSNFHDDCTLFIFEDMWKSDKKFRLYLPDNSFVKSIHYIKHISHNNILFVMAYTAWTFKLKLPHIIYKKLLLLYCPDLSLTEQIDMIIIHKYGSVQLRLIHEVLCPNAKICIIEEGIGEYYLTNSETKEPHHCLKRYVSGRYFLAPWLYKHESMYPIYQTPIISKDLEFVKTLNELFEYNDVVNQLTRYIYLSQPFATDYNDNAYSVTEQKILSEIINIVGSSNLCYKPHPRQGENPYLKRQNIRLINTNSSFESILLNMNNIDNYVLISVGSTALMSPKLLFDMEPYVICLYKLFKNIVSSYNSESNSYWNIISIMENIKGTYRNKERFIIPETLDELRYELNKLLSTNHR